METQNPRNIMEENDLRQPSQIGKPSIQWTTKEKLTLLPGYKAWRMGRIQEDRSSFQILTDKLHHAESSD
eukprot:scaffold6883_cov113-Cylindrotheca_fusiformis.AAC.2